MTIALSGDDALQLGMLAWAAANARLPEPRGYPDAVYFRQIGRILATWNTAPDAQARELFDRAMRHLEDAS